ncbi:MAG TPA: hypothetical protein VI094_06050 [Propionibacteriaceae bacterium]
MSKVLVVANQTLAGEEISEFVKSRMGEEPPEFTLLVPATARTPHREQAARLLGTISGGVPRQTLSTAPRTPPTMSRHETDSSSG